MSNYETISWDTIAERRKLLLRCRLGPACTCGGKHIVCPNLVYFDPVTGRQLSQGPIRRPHEHSTDK